jgi:hypothetical protein
MNQNFENREKKFVFIYSIDSLIENKISLLIQRALSPAKIECPLYSLLFNAKGLKAEFVEAMKRIELDIPYEMTYRNDFIKKYECFEVFGKFRISDVTYPSVQIVVGHEKEEREVYELVSPSDILKCGGIGDLNQILQQRYAQFKKGGPDEIKNQNSL